ncbi:hypothetical protein [uncultured Mediterranean phage uvMED]|nr:hypothetical protein [uncultured Mediterranean phage uvMED]BAR20077.1 hypothetical protein [uncultured Mediterranean phage uvMED]BAR20124.1 hypothetical protein [uncultured Mediterranean phage uvMED]BAR20184.1 hypothetical protein [uncultured Mediterranean phage uvMED]BAR20208.1 hypothetical protein [uncultured Mediterranean phage uvMED]
MAQHDYDIANQSFPAFRTDLNGVLEAINTSNSGTSRPSSAVAGTIWLDTTSATTPTLKYYDGAGDISLATLDHSANTVNWLDSTVSADLVNDTSPQLGGMLDVNGNAIGDGTNELLKFVETGSAVNELTITNNSTGNNPSLSATGGDTNIGLNLVPKGTGVLQGNGSALKIAGKETIWVPASAMYATTTAGADPQQIETTAGRPDIKVFDFDPSSDEFTQFAVAFPKSWNEGTVTFQYFWTPSNTNTGNCALELQAVACGEGDTIDVNFGTSAQVLDAGGGTVEDQQVSDESGAITIAGSPAVDQLCYFQVKRNADVGPDTFTGDCRLIGIKLFFTTDASNDA